MIRHGRARPKSALVWTVLLLACGTSAGQAAVPPSDTLDPLLSRLAWWVDQDLSRSYGYTAVASGAALAIGYRSDSGYFLPPSLKLLWPGNVALMADTSYEEVEPLSIASAQTALLSALQKSGGALFITPAPVFVYGVDSSFGQPWFLVTQGGATSPDTAMWDSGDLKNHWWRWSEETGANTIWPRPLKSRAPRGRQAILEGLRHCVLAARPQAGKTSTGLAAFNNVPEKPGLPDELIRLAVIRRAAAQFLEDELELWPPAEREPLKLVIYYFEKAAQGWTELSERAQDWALTSAQRREDLITNITTNETQAAVSLDALVSPKH